MHFDFATFEKRNPMHARTMTYTNFDDEEVTEVFHFNMSKSDIIRLEAEKKGGFSEYLKEMVKTEDTPTLLAQFERILLMSFGIKSPDGKHFDKSEEISARFKNHAAYDKLFWEIFNDQDKLAEFLIEIAPKETKEAMRKDFAEQKKADEAEAAVAPTPAIAPTPMPPTPPTPPPT
jgi:hypothetical protein